MALTSASGLSAEPNPYALVDESWISISGEVQFLQPDSFTLDYGDGSVIVEMDDGDRDADAYKLIEGDNVNVLGVIDRDLFELTSIEASSVFVEKLDTYFYSSAVDEEDMPLLMAAIEDKPASFVQGKVTDVDDTEFSINFGLNEIRVDVDDMLYNPLDDEGYQKVQVGDVVRVKGELDTDFLQGREFEAERVTTLRKAAS
ncbi:MAG: hypothetical protein NXH95_08365 [Pseudomonadaceae bacterium]|nr:hypothetical protein [Pseudomonadaceae bacterium]